MGQNERGQTLLDQITRGAVFTALAVIVNRASGMALQMILVRMVSVDGFGLFRLAMEISSFQIMWATFFVGGVSASSTTRVVSLYLAKGDTKAIRSGIVSGIVAVTGMAALLFPLMYVSLPMLLSRVFAVPGNLLPEAVSFFLWLMLYVWLASVAMVIAAALRSCEFFGAYSLLETSVNVSRLFLVPLLLYAGFGLNAIAWGWAIALFLGIGPAA
jgi:O-antigen/teichoic acid export membrane protein